MIKIRHETPLAVDMTKGSVLPHIISFAIPFFFGNLFQQLYNTADCMIVGKFLGRDSLAALGASTQFVFTLIGFFNGFATGAYVVISQAFGAKNVARLQKAIHTSVLAGFFIGIFISILGIFISPLVLHLIKVPESVFSMADSYLRIYFFGMVFLLLYNITFSVLRGLGDSRRPLYFLIFSSVVNIVLDLIFILVLNWGIKGAAWATVLSEAVSIIPAFYVLMKSDDVFKLRIKKLRIDSCILKEILRIGLPGAFSSSITAFSNTFLQKYVNAFGASCAAGWVVFSRFDQLAIMPMNAIVFAAMAFVSQNYEARKNERIYLGIQNSLKTVFVFISFLSVIMFIFARALTCLFISDEESVNFGVLFIRYTAPFYVLCGTSMLYCQILRGLSEPIIPMAVTFAGFVAFRQIFIFTTSHFFKSFAILALTYPLAWPITSLIMILYFKRKMRQIHASFKKIEV